MSFRNASIFKIGAVSADYHKQEIPRGDVRHVMSSSSIRAFAECPERWLHGYNHPDTDATRWGSMLDARVLTPDDFDSRYAIQPETYRNKEGEDKPWRNDMRIKAVADWHDYHEGKQPINKQERADVDAAAAALREDETIRTWQEESQTQVWVKGEWRDERKELVIPVQCLIDYVPRKESEFQSCLGDLKSTRSANLRSWSRWCWQAGYHIQAKWNLDLFNAATGEQRDTFCFILSENFAPWQPAKRMLSQKLVQLGMLQYQMMLADYCRCLETGKWPGYDRGADAIQGWSVVEPEGWMEDQVLQQMGHRTASEPEPIEEQESDEVPCL